MTVTPPPTVGSSERVFISVLTGASTPPPEFRDLGSFFHSIVCLSSQPSPHSFFENVLSDISTKEKTFFATALEHFTDVSVMPEGIQNGPEETRLVFCGAKQWPTRLDVMARFIAPTKEATTDDKLISRYHHADREARRRSLQFPAKMHQMLGRTASGSPIHDPRVMNIQIKPIVLDGFVPPLGGVLPPTLVVPKMRLSRDNVTPVLPENYEGTMLSVPTSPRGTPSKREVCLISERMINEPRLHHLDEGLVSSLQKVFKVFFELEGIIGFCVLDGVRNDRAYVFLKPSALGMMELLEPLDSGCTYQ